MTSEAQQREYLIGQLHTAFELNEQEAARLAEALKRGGPLVEPLHWELMVGHVRLKSEFSTLADLLRSWLPQRQAPAEWVELLPARIRPQFKYLYYVLRDNETYGGLCVSEHAI